MKPKLVNIYKFHLCPTLLRRRESNPGLSDSARRLYPCTWLSNPPKCNLNVCMLYADTNADPSQCTPDTTGICHPNATCTRVTTRVCACNPASSYRCKCNQGYVGDGLNCTSEPHLASIIVIIITIISFISGNVASRRHGCKKRLLQEFKKR